MRIQFHMEGGIAFFPRLSSPHTIDSDQLPEQEADELKRLVKAADFFALPAVVGSPAPGAADYRQYTITIEDEGKEHTVHVTDPIEDPNLQALVANLRIRRQTAS
jgi:hypothetical protein